MRLELPSFGAQPYAANIPFPEMDTLWTVPPSGTGIGVVTPVTRSRTYGWSPDMNTKRPSSLENDPSSAKPSATTVEVTPVETLVRCRLPSSQRDETHCPSGEMTTPDGFAPAGTSLLIHRVVAVVMFRMNRSDSPSAPSAGARSVL